MGDNRIGMDLTMKPITYHTLLRQTWTLNELKCIQAVLRMLIPGLSGVPGEVGFGYITCQLLMVKTSLGRTACNKTLNRMVDAGMIVVVDGSGGNPSMYRLKRKLLKASKLQKQ